MRGIAEIGGGCYGFEREIDGLKVKRDYRGVGDGEW